MIPVTQSDEPQLQVVLEALRKVYDPEVGVNVVDLGLIYRLEPGPGVLAVDVTMTTPACPMSEQLLDELEQALLACLPADCVPTLQLVWEPPWSPAFMSAKARDMLGWTD